jgi:L-alanine-DL-glutamate epimerase-like enolase superfamily enzyme
MKLFWKPFTLEFKHPFRIAHGVRSSTPVVFTRLDHEGLSGFGEASMPPYLGESHESVESFLSKVNLSQFSDLSDIGTIMLYIDSLAPGNTAAKASVDIALHDLLGKQRHEPIYAYYGADSSQTPSTSFTIGMDAPEQILQKLKEAEAFPLLKVKLGGTDDLLILETISQGTNKTFSVDVNQGWTDREFALDMVHRLKEMHVSFVEQPFRKDRMEDHAWLKERSPLPIIADESCQRLGDIELCRHSFDGVNIKLMKCTGLWEAKRMIDEARKHGLRLLIGCMSETSCAVSAAAALTPFAEWADLDGPLLIKNDVFDGLQFDSGKIKIPERPGIGVALKYDVFAGE